MSDPVYFEYASINTVNTNITKEQSEYKEKDHSGSLLKDKKNIELSIGNNESENLQRTSTNRTAFKTKQIQNKYELLRRQSLHKIHGITSTTDEDARKTISWTHEGPIIEVSL